MYKSTTIAALLVVVSSISIFSQVNLDAYKDLPVEPADQEIPFFTEVYKDATPYIPVETETEVVNPNEHVLIVEGVKTLTRSQKAEMDSVSVEAEIFANTPVVYKETLPKEVVKFINALNDIELKTVLNQMKNTSNNYTQFVMGIKNKFGRNATYEEVSDFCGWGI